jgi:hypothetical protein
VCWRCDVLNSRLGWIDGSGVTVWDERQQGGTFVERQGMPSALCVPSWGCAGSMQGVVLVRVAEARLVTVLLWYLPSPFAACAAG